MKDKLDKIWKDPVLSKVISAAIIGNFILIYNFTKSKLNN